MDETTLQVLHEKDSDGYSGYNNISNVTIVGCWAHARRKFNEAMSAIPDKTSKTSLVSKGRFRLLQ
ncbi:MAG: transposase [Halanaerobiales bacterium]|nr:transposase [Halanaerobiales bacterium]